jgi:DNA gyrase subunit A
VVRSSVAGVPAKGRDTMGVIFAKPDKNDRIIEVARNSERGLEGEESLEDDVTLAEDGGSLEDPASPAVAEESPAVESEDASGDAEPNEDYTEVPSE